MNSAPFCCVVVDQSKIATAGLYIFVQLLEKRIGKFLAIRSALKDILNKNQQRLNMIQLKNRYFEKEKLFFVNFFCQLFQAASKSIFF